LSTLEAKLAELEKLPVRVVKLTDAEAIEAQCVENLQREDIHPLEEALGFKSLLELHSVPPYQGLQGMCL
jgi:ParB family transcriptional regulator, chromosome partitioning protein